MASATGIIAGMYVDCANVPSGTTISSIVGTTITLSQNASSTGTASSTFRLITYRGRAAFAVSGFAGITGTTTSGSAATATSSWEYAYAAGLTGSVWLGSTARSKYTTAFYAKDYLGYALEVDTRHGDNTGHAIYTHSDAGNVGFGVAPDSTYRVKVSGDVQVVGQLSIPAGTITANSPLDISQTWNNSGVTFQGIKVNVTNTASGGASVFVSFQESGSAKFEVFRSGSVNIEASASYLVNGRGGWKANGDGILQLRNNGNSDFGRLQFGGTSSSFPAIKRSSADLQIRLADDSAYSNIDALSLKISGTKVVGARDTGWTAMTGTADESTVYDTASVTTAQLAGRVMALQAALTTHGLIGA